MKKIIYVLGIIFLILIILLNFIFTAHLDMSEHISINVNSLIYIIGILLLTIFMLAFTKYINKYLYIDLESNSKRKIRSGILIFSLAIYIIFMIAWLVFVRPGVGGDSIHVANLAQTFCSGDTERFLHNLTYAGIPLIEYMQAYHQQIPLAFVFSIFFKILIVDTVELLRIFNILGNILIVFSLYKITKQLSKNYEINKVRLFFLILTFISLPILSNFIYGDILSLALCLLAVYLMMEYVETKKLVYAIFASLSTMVAYMARMNSLIFVIATVIYLLLNFFNEIRKSTCKENILKAFVIIMYIVISIIPSVIVQNYYLNKFDLSKDKAYPSISYILMAMEEGPRANGWYSEEIGEHALKNLDTVKEEYADKIKERLKYFSENVGYTLKFYTFKIASMWTENTYSAIFNNDVNNYSFENFEKFLSFYQKALLIVTCLCSVIVLIQNRKNISTDVIFLITIFIGGFLFHILWEAKSRYIIPYIVVLIPVASIEIKRIFSKAK